MTYDFSTQKLKSETQLKNKLNVKIEYTYLNLLLDKVPKVISCE